MGDLKGHVIPGCLFYLLGLWWALGSLRRYFMRTQVGIAYTSTANFPCPLPCGRLGTWPIESIGKIVVCSIGTVAEIIFNLPHPSSVVVHHSTMYFFFLLSGIVDWIMHVGVPLPLGTDYASLALAFLVQGLLFVNHLHDRPKLDVQIHMFMVYVVFLTAVVILLETKFQKSIILTLSRSYLLMLLGSWLVEVGLILFADSRKSWDLNSDMDIMQASIFFSWHCAAHFIIIILMAAVLSCCYRVKDNNRGRNGSEFPLTQLNNTNSQSEYKILTAQDDDESDIEFEKPANKPSPPL